MGERSNRRLQSYRGTWAWILQRVSALVLVVLVPLKMYSGWGMMGKVPWFAGGSAAAIHSSTAIDVGLLLCILIHAFYGLRVIAIDFGWIREDRFFWRTTALALGIFAFCVYYLYVRDSGATGAKDTAAPASQWKAPPEAEAVKNPVGADAASIAAGKEMWQQNCAICHGDDGKGDGPQSAALAVAVGDLTSERTQSQSDGALFWKITVGKPPMPPFMDWEENERWNVVNYLRTLPGATR